MPPLPDVGPGQYLIDAFHKLRFARQGMEGLVQQTWVEIEAFMRATRMIETEWEAVVLFEMSWAYVLENQKATDPLRVPPMERSNG